MAEIPSKRVTFTSRTIEAGDGDHDEILTMIEPRCLLCLRHDEFLCAMCHTFLKYTVLSLGIHIYKVCPLH